MIALTLLFSQSRTLVGFSIDIANILRLMPCTQDECVKCSLTYVMLPFVDVRARRRHKLLTKGKAKAKAKAKARSRHATITKDGAAKPKIVWREWPVISPMEFCRALYDANLWELVSFGGSIFFGHVTFHVLESR